MEGGITFQWGGGGGGGGGRFIYKLKEGAWEWASALMQGLSKKS